MTQSRDNPYLRVGCLVLFTAILLLIYLFFTGPGNPAPTQPPVPTVNFPSLPTLPVPTPPGSIVIPSLATPSTGPRNTQPSPTPSPTTESTSVAPG